VSNGRVIVQDVIMKTVDRNSCNRNLSTEAYGKYENLSKNSLFQDQNTNSGPLEQGNRRLTILPQFPILLIVDVWPKVLRSLILI
jgi:hypothetical protein